MYIGHCSIPSNIEQALEQLKPWSHYYKYDDNTYTGFYPKLAEKLDGKTFCTKYDSPEVIELFRQEYENNVVNNLRFYMPIDFLKKIMGSDFYNCSVLDIGCNDGAKSLYFQKAGARRVTGVEIRKDCVERAKFAGYISGIPVQFQHMPISADDEKFAEVNEPADIVASFGILYHLNDHITHIKNLRKLTKKVMIMFSYFQSTRTKFQEDKNHPYKSFTGECIGPTKQEIFDMLIEAGFNTTLEIQYHPQTAPIPNNCCTYLISFV